MTVHFVPWNTSLDLMKEANRLYDIAGTFDCVEKGDLVAVKLHVESWAIRIICHFFCRYVLFP